MSMAIVKARWRVCDADHWLSEHRAGITHRLSERTPQVEREITVAIVREVIGDAGRFVVHGATFCSRLSQDASRDQRCPATRGFWWCRTAPRHVASTPKAAAMGQTYVPYVSVPLLAAMRGLGFAASTSL